MIGLIYGNKSFLPRKKKKKKCKVHKLTVRCPGMIFVTSLSLSCFSFLPEYQIRIDSSWKVMHKIKLTGETCNISRIVDTRIRE